MDEKVSERYEEYKKLFPCYVEMNLADKQKMADLLCKAKGESRSLRKFADDIDVNVSTISRISNKKIARHVDSEVIAKMAAGAESENENLFDELMSANGMQKVIVEKHCIDLKQLQRYKMRALTYCDNLKKINIQEAVDCEGLDQTWKAIANSLTETDIKYEIDFDDSNSHFWNYRVTSDVIDGDWLFEVRKCSNFSSINSAIRSIYKIMADHFRLDRDDYGKVSIVFDNRLAFKEAITTFEQYAPPFEMSFILVSKFKVEQEFILRKPDGSLRCSIFSR